MKKALTIAGSDSSGGAGIQADLKTFSAIGVYGMSIITAVTAQNSQEVLAVQNIEAKIIEAQINAILQDIQTDAVKIGMLSQTSAIKVVAQKIKNFRNIVLDPVMISKSGFHLLQPQAKKDLVEKLIPQVDIITPNTIEAEEILKTMHPNRNFDIKTEEDMKEAAQKIFSLGCRFVLVKGGHMQAEDSTDILYDGKDFLKFSTKRIATTNTHGTGCTLSSAIAAYLAWGFSMQESVAKAKEYIQAAIEQSFSIGSGVGPTHHFFRFYNNKGESKK